MGVAQPRIIAAGSGLVVQPRVEAPAPCLKGLGADEREQLPDLLTRVRANFDDAD